MTERLGSPGGSLICDPVNCVIDRERSCQVEQECLNDIAEEGTFVWSDGTPLGYEAWVAGQPNDGAMGSSEDCMFMAAESDGAWKDADCLEILLPYVCEGP